eukprot:FR742538.1.p1 GENE.FR742538.1~~FR742538.1.p1  ORF type:complete len:225 (+),score=12.21 FR742538.1:20-694(+)
MVARSFHRLWLLLLVSLATSFTPSRPTPATRLTSRRHAEQSARELELEARELQVQADSLRLEVAFAELEASKGKAGQVPLAPADVEAAKAAVLAANDKFYSAFASRRLANMKKCWHESNAVVVHAGKPPISGWEDVLHSYQGVFRSKSAENMEMSDARVVSISGSNAVVVCNEAMNSMKMVATNIFEIDRDATWKLVHHHSSPVMFPSVPRPRNETKLAFGESF